MTPAEALALTAAFTRIGVGILIAVAVTAWIVRRVER